MTMALFYWKKEHISRSRIFYSDNLVEKFKDVKLDVAFFKQLLAGAAINGQTEIVEFPILGYIWAN